VPQNNIHLLAGQPEEQIPSTAKTIGAQLVIIGTVGKCDIPHGHIGNTAERILSQLNCDVLALQPDQLSHVDALL
jgi:universal stress protein E